MTYLSADYLNKLEEAVDRFSIAFEEWMKTQDEGDRGASRGYFPTVCVKEGVDVDEVRRLELDVAAEAGAASRAVQLTGAYVGISGVGEPIDPIANWFTMSRYKPLVDPRDVRMVIATVKGRLKALALDIQAQNNSEYPVFSPANFHSVIWAEASERWVIHDYRVAVREAAEGLTNHWKDKLGRNDVDATRFWQETLSPGEPKPGAPKLVWPGEPADKTVKSMRGGIEPLSKALNALAVGLNLTVRNVATHTRDELSEQEAMERLAAYSYFARLLDQCEIKRAERAV
ncbi:TIGR02391 family protein [uncultured Propionibacterium sp.]|uniref:TIGR02391 family protein n=1 Tax=uncultured Propionibacterium sp. TaxID=218066 RepID=UPI002930EDF5|nr:TIGR02391 family protein [uncultured Propionibacterium sp.]